MSFTSVFKSIAAKLFLTIACIIVTSAYGYAEPSQADREEHLIKLRKVAESGDPDAQYELGYLNDTGKYYKVLARDTRKAAEWYEKAALQGHAKAQTALGQLYINGYGVQQDYVVGVDWLQKAAEQGDADAHLELGWLYADGEGIPEDPVKALKWWQNAAERDFAHAQFTLGLIYNKGEIVPRDVTRTVELWSKAATQGYHPAQFNLGSMYYFGEGVPKDPVKAVSLWEKAAAFGYIDAQYNLALAYHLGSGIKKNELLAYVWSNLASEYGGSPIARKLRDSIILTKDQQELASQMSRHWQIGKVYR